MFTTSTVFYIMTVLLFITTVKVYNTYAPTMLLNISLDVKLVIISMIAAVIIQRSVSLMQPQETYELSMPCACKGGDYLYQTDSERSVKCRKLYSTPEGRASIEKCNYCNKGLIGL